MPSRWCCRRASAAIAASAAVAVAAAGSAATTAGAATVLDKRVTIEIRDDGTVRERTALSVRLDGPGDVEVWSTYAVYVDDHRELVDAEGAAVHPNGDRQKVKRRHRDEVAAPAAGIFHESSRYHLLQFPGVRVGSVIEVETAVDVAPYYPAGAVRLYDDDRVERLRVEVRGGGAGWRWRLDGSPAGLTVAELAGGVTVTGGGLEAAEAPPDSPGGSALYPVLRYGWGDDESWRGVGRWYNGLLAALPRAEPAVLERARALAADDDRRATLEALTAMVQKQVRYVAVEIGIGGFRPSPPGETLARAWGDCKDKGLLLIDLLAAAGIPAHPALALLASDDRIDPEFPAPSQFNHLIVAVPATAVEVGDGDAVAGGYLFVDPTQPAGGARWLGPGVQGQYVLVVLPEGGDLVRLPVLPEGEATELVVNVHLGPSGDAAGGAALHLRGALAQVLLERTRGDDGRTDSVLRTVLGGLLPGAELGRVGWTEGEGAAPEIDLAAGLEFPRLLQGTGDRVSLRLPSLRSAPEPRVVSDRTAPLVTDAGRHRAVWQVALPDGCLAPEDDEVAAANEAGSFRQTVTRRGETSFTLEREVVLDHRWYGPELLPALAELSLAEHRAHRRRLRFSCPGAESAAAAGP